MRRFTLFAFASTLLVSPLARATAEFPQQMVTDLAVTCSNPIWDNNGCTICHTDNNGGLGTATKPFGRYMKTQGLTPFNDTKLSSILGQLQAESPHATDTNCDGVPDVDELTSCQWQNLAVDQCGADAGTDGGAIPVGVYYGCSTGTNVGERDAPALPGSAAIAIAGLLGAIVLRAKTRKR